MIMQRVLTATLLAASVCLGAGACGGKQEPEFGIPDQQAIRAVTSTLESAFNAKDVEKILTVYTENAVFMPPNKPLLRGRAALKGFYDGLLNGGSKDLKITPADVAGHGPLAYESGSYSMTNGTVPDRGKYLFIFRNFNGSWKIEYTSWSSDLPPS
jgi:Ketosteroid isomerase homolog